MVQALTVALLPNVSRVAYSRGLVRLVVRISLVMGTRLRKWGELKIRLAPAAGCAKPRRGATPWPTPRLSLSQSLSSSVCGTTTLTPLGIFVCRWPHALSTGCSPQSGYWASYNLTSVRTTLSCRPAASRPQVSSLWLLFLDDPHYVLTHDSRAAIFLFKIATEVQYQHFAVLDLTQRSD